MEDAERPERHTTRSVVRWACGRLSFRTLQRRNALRDAPRHTSMQHRAIKIGRRASRAAYDAERRTMGLRAPVVPHAPA
ncbi:DUF1534 domain-containing protein [Pseudomonas syringae]|nr:DUF1534 domain-containing protein [Pseudomonas syringae]